MPKLIHVAPVGARAPEDLRNAFDEALTLWADTPDPCDPIVEFRGMQIALSTLCVMLWNCTDIMRPGLALEAALEAELASKGVDVDSLAEDETYGEAARWMRPRLKI
jgi:hypothetical protein